MVNIPQSQLDRIQPLDRARFEQIKDAEFRPGYDLIGLKYLRDKAGNERNLRELYRGRALYELLQNADDAGAQKVVYILSPEGLAFAHDGRWFTVDNFRSLADGWSDKDPNECIGHKGLGFRSVLDITPAPHLMKVQQGDFFSVKFTWALNNGHIAETLNRQPELRNHYEAWTKQGQLCCPVMAIPGLARKHTLGAASDIFDALTSGDYADDFTTMFWFPAKDSDISPTVLSELSPTPIIADEYGRKRLHNFVGDEVSTLLPFLVSISQVKVYERDRCIAMAQMPAETRRDKEGQITVVTEARGLQYSRSFFRMNFEKDIPLRIQTLSDTPKAVKRMNRAHLSLLVELDDGKPVHNAKSCFHVYFPTEEPTGMGFAIHGDFYVKPDRTRLMKARYNEWLLKCAASAAANEFLTSLLEHYPARSVFEALSPAESLVSDSSALFGQLFAKCLQERRQPFVPTSVGLLTKEEVLLPPVIDTEGFWEGHFTSDLSELARGKKAFLTPSEDGKKTRAFLDLAKVDVLKSEALIEFIEAVSTKSKDATWWYECYSYMANDETLSRCDRSFFEGRRLVPVGEAGVATVPTDEGSAVASLPPTGSVSVLNVPKCFASIFVFVDNSVAQLLQSGKDTVRSWVLDRFHISRFEATELLPRAIRSVVPQIFTGELKVTRRELIAAWKFIKAVTDASRMIKSSDFWDDISRFPLPLQRLGNTETFASRALAPAFLTYWPDSWIEGDNCLWRVEGLRRVDERFLNDLGSGSTTRKQWQGFLSQIGVSKAPKLLRYSRIIAGDELPLEENGPSQFQTGRFSGMRQSDINKAVTETIVNEQLWGSTVRNFASCGHGIPRVLQSLTILEGLRQCAEKAAQEFDSGEPNWSRRLWVLAKQLPLSDIHGLDADTAFCRGGKGGGHVTTGGQYIEQQLRAYRWLPTSLGPANNSECFLRFSSRRLISSGTLTEELGDKLLPYVVVDDSETLARLQGLGIEILDDADSAPVSALFRALSVLGERLASEWGQQEILKSPARWRLVRGAIQEIYRKLNQQPEEPEFAYGIIFATRSTEGIRFCATPLYYADPGSAIEQAFMGMIPLFDADRPCPRLFDQIPVIRLQSSGERKTVEEKLLSEEESKPVTHLHDEIVNKLSPFLLAPIVARSERQKDFEIITRRLRERFAVKANDHLTVSFSLIAEPSVQRSVDFPKFYLQRRIVPGQGAVEESHYVLYIAGSAKDLIGDLDADALGQALTPVFFVDRVTEDLAGLFPRIAYKYQQAKGKLDEIRDFLYYQLGISREAQEAAMAILSAEVTETAPAPLTPPLPMKIIAQPLMTTEQHGGIRQSIDKHQQIISQRLTEILQPFTSTESGTIRTPSGAAVTESHLSRGGRIVITSEQQDRGKRGEEEIKRRLQLPGGWAGFRFVADKRTEDCGYDFLGTIGDRQVKLEVKTFTINGRIIVTVPELHAAAESQDNYYLVGVLDDGKPEAEWCTFVVRNPLRALLSTGEIDIEAKLYAPAADIFQIDTK
jgi:hypothetical protein